MSTADAAAPVRLWHVLLGALLLLPCQVRGQPDPHGPDAAVQLPAPVLRQSMHRDEVVLVINENDPASVESGAYYQRQRGIPAENVVRTRFRADSAALSVPEFEALYQEVQRRAPVRAQAYVLAWTRPYKVGCMGITSAFAFGFDADYCSASCGKTRISPYFDSASGRPWSDYRVRPAMLLAGASISDVYALIDRGVAADHTYPTGTAYLASTGDQARNVRAAGFARTAQLIGMAFRVKIMAGALRDRSDIMAYFTGLADVPGLETLRFRPGAAADHLTSFGGQLTDSPQMSALQWLSAGATASYGTVTEPCAYAQKFPHPGVFLRHYLDGDTLLEAYWKSVAWPGEGVFIGEPLARPFGARVRMGMGAWMLEAYAAAPRSYAVTMPSASTVAARSVGAIALSPGPNRVRLPPFGESITIDPYPSMSRRPAPG